MQVCPIASYHTIWCCNRGQCIKIFTCYCDDSPIESSCIQGLGCKGETYQKYTSPKHTQNIEHTKIINRITFKFIYQNKNSYSYGACETGMPLGVSYTPSGSSTSFTDKPCVVNILLIVKNRETVSTLSITCDFCMLMTIFI